MKKLVKLAIDNLWSGIADYRRYARETAVLDDISDAFVERLAEDSVNAKADLRGLFSKSDAWNPDLQAIVINGTKTHNPDYFLVRSLAEKILNPASLNFDLEKRALVDRAINFFVRPDDFTTDYIAAIQELAPRAYAPNKKKSRVFKALCSALGVADESKGSSFQKLFAQFADELNGKQLDFKLFVSINPVHFITMSNPKYDERGTMLTSCHSFNSTDYEYNCGCSGYARDNVTFIVFTAATPDEPETLNNRKTSRQIFCYKPFNGLLLQSRLYNTHGGTRGHQEDSDLYRDLIQREISKLEEIPNLWKTENYLGNKRHIYIDSDYGFGGYEDWKIADFGSKISVHQYHLDDFETFKVGTYGLCISCGEEISSRLYCDDCDPEGRETCDECGCRTDSITGVLNQYGERIYVCPNCLEEGFSYCCHCDEYYPCDQMTLVDNTYVCQNCVENHCAECAQCGQIHYRNNMYDAYDRHGNAVLICDDCHYDYYECCEHCGEIHHEDNLHSVHGRRNCEINVCDNCFHNFYSECERCGEYFNVDDLTNGLCHSCLSEEDDNQ